MPVRSQPQYQPNTTDGYAFTSQALPPDQFQGLGKRLVPDAFPQVQILPRLEAKANSAPNIVTDVILVHRKFSEIGVRITGKPVR